MTTLELKEKINDAESEILKIINNLNYEAGIKVEGIELKSYTSVLKTGVTDTTVTDVKITITL